VLLQDVNRQRSDADTHLRPVSGLGMSGALALLLLSPFLYIVQGHSCTGIAVHFLYRPKMLHAGLKKITNVCHLYGILCDTLRDTCEGSALQLWQSGGFTKKCGAYLCYSLYSSL
jgi:hypothetical protein